MIFKRSPWVFVFHGAGCNGCNLEVFATVTPRYDVERLGILIKHSPRNADILLVEGMVNKKNASRIKTVYEQMASPKAVVAVGSCAISGGVFADSYNHAGPLDKIVPVDVYVPGCPPRPEAIIDGILKGVEILENRRKGKKG